MEDGIQNVRTPISTESTTQLGFRQSEMEFIGRNFLPTTDLQVNYSDFLYLSCFFRSRKAGLSLELVLLQYERDQNFDLGRSKQIAAKYQQQYSI